MVAVYAIVLVIGFTSLLCWVGAHAYASGADRPGVDPEVRFGVTGRRVVAGLVGFAMAGLSAEFSPRDLSWPLALVLALIGGIVLAWYAGRPALDPRPAASAEGASTLSGPD